MPIDILFLVALAYGFWQGFRQGIIHTVFNVAAYVFGLTIAFKMTPSVYSAAAPPLLSILTIPRCFWVRSL